LELEEKNHRKRESVLLPNQNKKEEERKKERGVPWWPGHRRWAVVVFPATR
jgi:hypothetical protein